MIEFQRAMRAANGHGLVLLELIRSKEKDKGFTAKDILSELEERGIKDMSESQVYTFLVYLAETGPLYMERRETFFLGSSHSWWKGHRCPKCGYIS